MSEKEKLIELLQNCSIKTQVTGDISYKSAYEKIADYLLKNGVIVLPVEIGQTVYHFGYSFIIKKIEMLQDEIIYRCSNLGTDDYMAFCESDIGKTVFPTKKSAEKNIEGRCGVMAEYIDRENLLKNLSRMIDYCKKDNKVNGLTALFQVGDAIIDCPTVVMKEERTINEYIDKQELLNSLEKKIKADNERRMAVVDRDFIDLVNDATVISDMVEVDDISEQIIRKKSEVSDYWQNDVKQYRTMQGYSDIEHDVDNFLRGYNEAVEDILAILDGTPKERGGEK